MEIRATGVGSREAPPEACEVAEELAYETAKAGWLWTSGGAPGMDTAFEKGVDRAKGKKEIYLPYRGFNGNSSHLCGVTEEALALASAVHPAWDRLKESWRHLHARNCYQVLSETLDLPSDLVVCWTPDGCETRKARSRATGGTATAIVLAADRGIPVFNLKNMDSRIRLNGFLAKQKIAYRVPLIEPLPQRQEALF